MKFSTFPYQLQAANDFNRQGFLIRAEFKDGIVGYADCHPWVCLGDAPVEEQLHHLKTGTLTPLLKCSLDFARLDAEARAKKASVFEGLTIPPTHLLIPNLLHCDQQKAADTLQQGFDRFKVKLGKRLDEEITVLNALLKVVENPKIKVRLDFGSSISQSQFEQCLGYIPLERGDFFEDPFPYEPQRWEEVQKKYGVSFACDHESLKALGYPRSADILVVKPAIQEVSRFVKDERSCVITSYVDHPLGVMCAAYSAAKFYQQFPEKLMTCGLLTHEVYFPDAFSARIKRKGCRLIPPQGYGFGFDDLLEAFPWG